MARKCGVCNTADLIPSGCGCLNPECHNYVGKWKSCIAGYREDAKEPSRAIPDNLKALVHEASQAKPDRDVEAWAEKLGNDICQEPPKEKGAEPPPKTVPKKRKPRPQATFD